MQTVRAWVSFWFTASSVPTLSMCSPRGLKNLQTHESKVIAEALHAFDPSFDQVEEIAQKIIQLQGQGADVYCRRKGNFYVKPIVLANNSAFFLLPVKKAEHDSLGADKYGRRALYGWFDADGWKIERVWNLTSLKKDGIRMPMFTQARRIEGQIPENVLREIAPKLLYDFDVEGCQNKRCAFYAYYKCLTDVLNSREFCQDQQRFLAIARSAAIKLAMLHKAGFSWRDLKPDNILVDDENEVRFCDLDSCTEVLVEPAGSKPGTVLYMPPEMRNNLPTNNKKRDVFAFGCLLHQMMNDFQPETNFPSVAGVQVKNDPTFTTIKQAFECISEWARAENPDYRPDMDTIANLLLPDYPPG
ncbi:MAG: protein kinase [Chlamydiales bacterium]|nr:protein kinase [Chlamydiales bacterium]